MATLKLEIVTPDAKAYSDDVELVVLPAMEGEMGVYPMHVPTIARIQPGELVVTKGGQRLHLAVGEGFVEITQDHVNVLTDMAIEEAHIDPHAAEEAVKRAQETLAAGNLGSEENALVEASLQRSLAQLKVKRRQHT